MHHCSSLCSLKRTTGGGQRRRRRRHRDVRGPGRRKRSRKRDDEGSGFTCVPRLCFLFQSPAMCVCVRWSPPPLLQLLCIVSRVHTHKLLTPSASRLLLSLRSHDAVGTHDLLSNFDADAAFHLSLSLSPVVRSSCFPVIRVPRQTLAHTNRKRQTDRGRERQPRRWEARGREVRLPHLFFRLFSCLSFSNSCGSSSPLT